jgi:hypothetical protein
LSNSGTPTIGAGSALDVTGNFTQTSAGTLGIQVGGTPASGQYGQVAVTGSAALDGSLNISLAATSGELDVSLPALTLGTPYQDSFSAAGQEHYYQVTVPAGGSLVVTLDSTASTGATALYINQGTQPTPYNYQEAADVANQADQTVTVPQLLSAGTYYVLAESVSGSAAASSFSITAQQTSLAAISAISPSSGGNGGNLTVEIDGTNISPSATASLKLGATTLSDTAIDFVSASQIFATFDLAGATLGTYTLSVQQAGQPVTAPTSFHVVASQAQPLQLSLATPAYVRAGRTGTIVVNYTNTSANDIAASLLLISSTNPDM